MLHLSDMTKELMKCLNVNMPDSALKQFNVKAVLKGKDMSELVNGWIGNYLKK